MRFLHKNNLSNVILVISDLHLGAGVHVNGRRNYLEDFHFDKELVDFLKYYSSEDYHSVNVELIINGDFFDFLAIPFVDYFDDEYWSEKAAIEKLKHAMKAHYEVMQALGDFASVKGKKITYIIGNHDAEMVFKSCQDEFMSIFDEKNRSKIQVIVKDEYRPSKEVVIKHGHNYEIAHRLDLEKCIISTKENENYFVPPWGSYYVTRIINKYKAERSYINCVKPIRHFLIWGIVFDTLFTLRFMFSNAYYFIMVRILDFINDKGNKFADLVKNISLELELFHDLESMTADYFIENKEVKALLVGHTHEPTIKSFPSGQTFINTGTWTKMFNLDFEKKQNGHKLTYAQINYEIKDNDENKYDFSLNVWQGKNKLPYQEFQ